VTRRDYLDTHAMGLFTRGLAAEGVRRSAMQWRPALRSEATATGVARRTCDRQTSVSCLQA